MPLYHTLPQLSEGIYVFVKWHISVPHTGPNNIALYWSYQQNCHHRAREFRPQKTLNENKHMVTPREVK